MRILVTALTCLTVGVAFAQDQAEEPTQEQIEILYRVSCDPTVLKDAENEKEAKEMAEMRDQIQTVLKDGKAGFDKLVEEGNAQDIGPIGAILVCSIVDTIKGEIASKGCKDPKGKAIDTKEGVQLCTDIIAELKKNSDDAAK